nr:hypothetical protein [Achromobacter pestifer]
MHLGFQFHAQGQQAPGLCVAGIAAAVGSQRGQQRPQGRQQRLVQIGQAQLQGVGLENALFARTRWPARMLQVLVAVVDGAQARRRGHFEVRAGVFAERLLVGQQDFDSPRMGA